VGKVKWLELWWQLYVTWLPVLDLGNFRLFDFCWTECTYRQNGLFLSWSCKPLIQRRSGPRYSPISSSLPSFHLVCSTHGSGHSKTLLLLTCYVSCSNPLFACTSSTQFPLFRLPWRWWEQLHLKHHQQNTNGHTEHAKYHTVNIKAVSIYLCSVPCILESYEELGFRMREFSHCQFLQLQVHPSGPVKWLAEFWSSAIPQ
jgi:hypothetical protein